MLMTGLREFSLLDHQKKVHQMHKRGLSTQFCLLVCFCYIQLKSGKEIILIINIVSHSQVSFSYTSDTRNADRSCQCDHEVWMFYICKQFIHRCLAE